MINWVEVYPVNILARISPKFGAQDESKLNSSIVQVFRHLEDLNALQLILSEVEGKMARDHFGLKTISEFLT